MSYIQNYKVRKISYPFGKALSATNGSDYVDLVQAKSGFQVLVSYSDSNSEVKSVAFRKAHDEKQGYSQLEQTAKQLEAVTKIPYADATYHKLKKHQAKFTFDETTHLYVNTKALPEFKYDKYYVDGKETDFGIGSTLLTYLGTALLVKYITGSALAAMASPIGLLGIQLQMSMRDSNNLDLFARPGAALARFLYKDKKIKTLKSMEEFKDVVRWNKIESYATANNPPDHIRRAIAGGFRSLNADLEILPHTSGIAIAKTAKNAEEMIAFYDAFFHDFKFKKPKVKPLGFEQGARLINPQFFHTVNGEETR